MRKKEFGHDDKNDLRRRARKKSALTVLLAAVLLCAACLLPAYAASRKLGDVDGNGSVTAADARLILRASVGLEELRS